MLERFTKSLAIVGPHPVAFLLPLTNFHPRIVRSSDALLSGGTASSFPPCLPVSTRLLPAPNSSALLISTRRAPPPHRPGRAHRFLRFFFAFRWMPGDPALRACKRGSPAATVLDTSAPAFSSLIAQPIQGAGLSSSAPCTYSPESTHHRVFSFDICALVKCLLRIVIASEDLRYPPHRPARDWRGR